MGAHFQLRQKTSMFNKDSIFDNGKCGKKRCVNSYIMFMCLSSFVALHNSKYSLILLRS